MIKIIRNKGLITFILIVFISFINIFLIGIPLEILKERFAILYIKIIFYTLLLIANVIIIIVFTKKLLKWLDAIVYVNNQYIRFKTNKNEFQIPVSNIQKLVYKKNKNDYYELSIILFDNTSHALNISRKDASKLSSIINIEMNYEKKKEAIPFKEKIKKQKDSFLQLIKENKQKIIFTIIGLFISIFSIVLYVNFKSFVYLTILLCLINLTYGIIQLYYIYFKEKFFSKTERITLTVFFALIFVLISFIIMIIAVALLKQAFTVDLLVYSIMLLPSFIVVIAIVLLAMLLLGGA